METAPSPKTSLTVCWMTQLLIPEGFNLHQNHDENLKYGISVYVSSTTGHKGPQGDRDIALIFLQPRR